MSPPGSPPPPAPPPIDASEVARGWPALTAARAHDTSARLPFEIAGEVVGSVARTHLGALQRFTPALRIDRHKVTLQVAAAERTGTLAQINHQLRALGLIKAWRDEPYALPGAAGTASLATIERAASRFWGTLTFGAHATGYVAGPDGRPERLWIAKRAVDKATDPGKFDNLIGGGVPIGQTPLQALQREAWEEAGLRPEQLLGVRTGSVLRLCRDIPEGLQHEWLHSFDLPMLAGLRPHNQDGEVAGFDLLPVAQALQLAAGDNMTVDAALVTLDFAVRHGLLSGEDSARLAGGCAGLRIES
jgi:8-oxo-dGTP pyrophosphatase MutT (NUDIX family)